jgi:hypothetical protein
MAVFRNSAGTQVSLRSGAVILSGSWLVVRHSGKFQNLWQPFGSQMNCKADLTTTGGLGIGEVFKRHLSTRLIDGDDGEMGEQSRAQQTGLAR